MVSIVECVDNMEFMGRYPDGYFELAVVDPPYGIGQDGRKNDTRSKLARAKNYRDKSRYDDNSPAVEYFEELIRVSQNQIIWGANHFISKLPFDSSCWIIWDKDNGLTDYADCELAYTSFSTAARKFKYKWQGMLQENMKHREIRLHPNQKPIALYKWLLKNYAKPGDKILDTHMGSQSSRIAAHDMGFDYYGCELDPEYFKSGCKRYENHISQLSIF